VFTKHKFEGTVATRGGQSIKTGEQLIAVARRFPELGIIITVGITRLDRGWKCV